MLVEIPETVFAGSPLYPSQGASVYVYARGTTTPTTVYPTWNGGTPIAQPLTTDARGRIEGYVAQGSYDLYVVTSADTYTQAWEAAIGDSTGLMADPRAADGTDQSTYLQGLIDGLNSMGGGRVRVPPKTFVGKVVIKPYVYLDGCGPASILRAPSTGGATAVVDSPGGSNHGLDPHDCGVMNMRIDGFARGGGRGKGINLVSANSDEFHQETYAGQGPAWWDGSIVIRDVMVLDTSSDGVYVGRNFRESVIDNLFSFLCREAGLNVMSTDARFSNVQCGECADGFKVQNANNAFTACKGWYSFGNKSGDGGANFVGGGNDWYVNAADRTMMAKCEAQDGYQHGMYLDSKECQIDLLVGGQPVGLAMGGTAQRNVINLTGGVADRTQLSQLISNDGTSVTDNIIRAQDSPSARLGGWVPVAYTGGALPHQNVLEGPPLANQYTAIGASGAPAFQNSWVNWGSPYHVAGFQRVAGKKVRLFGCIKTGALGTTAFTLPAGCRPATEQNLPCGSWTSTPQYALVQVYANGDVKPQAGATGFFSLDGVEFEAAAT